MTVGQLRAILANLPDETPVEATFDDLAQDFIIKSFDVSLEASQAIILELEEKA